MGLISQNLNSKLDEIVKKCFEGNRLLDRISNQLDLKFVMTKSSEVIHQRLAHKYPNPLADMVSKYQGDRNMETVYGMTPLDGTVYDTPLQIFETYFEYQLQLERLLNEAVDVAMSEGDFFTLQFLFEFIEEIIPYTKQALLYYDKAKLYDDWMRFDNHIERFTIID